MTRNREGIHPGRWTFWTWKWWFGADDLPWNNWVIFGGSMGCIPSNGKFGKSFDSNTHWGGDIWDTWSFEGNIWKPNKIEVWLILVNFCFPVQCGWFWGEPAVIFFRGVVTSHITHSYWHDLFFLGGGKAGVFRHYVNLNSYMWILGMSKLQITWKALVPPKSQKTRSSQASFWSFFGDGFVTDSFVEW